MVSLTSLRNRLNLDAISDTHECALVLSVEPELHNHVIVERHRFANDEVIARQLDPHITLLYGGFQPPEVLRQMEQLAISLATARVSFEIGDIATFSNRNGFITNIHFRVHSEQLHALHLDALRRYGELGLKLQTAYAGPHYVPHMSVYDRILLPKNITTMISRPPCTRSYQAGACHLVGEPR